MIMLGLTGSIGMGKSTIANMLRFLGVPVHDADACVHDLMQHDKDTNTALSVAFPPHKHPKLYDKDGAINRTILGKIIFKDNEKRQTLEQILHPRVRQSQTKFINEHRAKGIKILALDIPLLFETGGDAFVDYTLTARAPDLIQRTRVLSRANMDEDKFHSILQKQMPNKEKELRSDYVIQTGIGRANSMRQLKSMLQEIRSKENPPPLQESPKQYYTYS